MKSKIIIFGLSMLSLMSTRPTLQSAQQRTTVKSVLSAEQEKAAFELAKAIFNNDFRSISRVEQIFNDYFLEFLIVYDKRSTAINRIKALDEAVRKSLLQLSPFAPLKALDNKTGKRFKELMREFGTKLFTAPKAAGPAQPIVVKETIAPKKAAQDYTQFVDLPDLALSIIASNLSDIDLARFGKTSKRMQRIAKDVASRRPGGMWSVFQPTKMLIKAHQGLVVGVFTNLDDNIISVGQNDQRISVWDGKTHELIKEIHVNAAGDIKVAAFAPSTNLLALCFDQKIGIWNVETGTMARDFSNIYNVNFMTFDPAGQTLAAAGYSVHVLNVITGQARKLDTGYGEIPWRAAFSRDGRALAIGGFRDAPLTVWNVDNFKKIDEFKTSMAWPFFLTDGRLIVLKPFGAGFDVLDATTGKLMARLVAGRGMNLITWITLSNDNVLIAASGPGLTNLWNMKNWQRLQDLANGNMSRVTALSFSQDNTKLFVGCQDGSIIVWKIL